MILCDSHGFELMRIQAADRQLLLLSFEAQVQFAQLVAGDGFDGGSGARAVDVN